MVKAGLKCEPLCQKKKKPMALFIKKMLFIRARQLLGFAQDWDKTFSPDQINTSHSGLLLCLYEENIRGWQSLLNYIYIDI